MKFYKAVLKWLSSLLLHGALLLIIASLSVSFLFGNRNSAKEVLEESGVYNKFVNAILDDNIKSSQGKRNVLPFSDIFWKNYGIYFFNLIVGNHVRIFVCSGV